MLPPQLPLSQPLHEGITTSATNIRPTIPSISSKDIASVTSSISESKTIEYSKRDLINLLNFLIILFTLLSLISISITFIFPLWLTINLNTYFINTANNNYSIATKQQIVSRPNSYLLKNNTFKIDVGLWETKWNDELEILNDNSQSFVLKNDSLPRVISWLNTNDANNRFLIEFMNIIQVNISTIFALQTLEILHLIFTFISLCISVAILCFCLKYRKKFSYCWYVVSFVVTLVSIALGLAVIITLGVWEINNKSSENLFYVTFNWCYWLAIGELGSLAFATFLIFIYILVAIFLHRNRHSNLRGESSMAIMKDSRGTPSTYNYRRDAAAAATTTTATAPSRNHDGNYRLPRLSAISNIQHASTMNKQATNNVDNYTYYNGNASYRN